MRKSMYKFGESFSSSFHKEKEITNQMSPQSVKKTEKKEQEDQKQKSIKKEIPVPVDKGSKKNKFIDEDHEDISKKFDEME